jgi:zinc/manganese transport system substrate-binding protein
MRTLIALLTLTLAFCVSAEEKLKVVTSFSILADITK